MSLFSGFCLHASIEVRNLLEDPGRAKPLFCSTCVSTEGGLGLGRLSWPAVYHHHSWLGVCVCPVFSTNHDAWSSYSSSLSLRPLFFFPSLRRSKKSHYGGFLTLSAEIEGGSLCCLEVVAPPPPLGFCPPPILLLPLPICFRAVRTLT